MVSAPTVKCRSIVVLLVLPGSLLCKRFTVNTITLHLASKRFQLFKVSFQFYFIFFFFVVSVVINILSLFSLIIYMQVSYKLLAEKFSELKRYTGYLWRR